MSVYKIHLFKMVEQVILFYKLCRNYNTLSIYLSVISLLLLIIFMCNINNISAVKSVKIVMHAVDENQLINRAKL